MEILNPKDIIIQKALAQNIIDELNIIHQKNNDTILKLAEQYNNVINHMINAKSLKESEKYSTMLDEFKSKFTHIFAVNDKIELLIKRNEIRINYFEFKIKTEKIINFEVNKKQLISKIDSEKINMEDKLLNINQSKESIVPVFFNDKILILKDGKLSLDNNNNYQILKQAEENDFKIIADKFPTMLMTITDKQLTDIRFKEKVLKQLITIIDDKLKNQPVEKINDFLGYPLDLSRESPKDYQEYIEEIKNLLQVRVKQYLEENYPDFSTEINSRLKCNEQSLFLPPKYFVKLEEEIEEESENYTETLIDGGEDEEIDDFNDFLMGLLGDDGESD